MGRTGRKDYSVKILVVGATGAIGSAAGAKLASRGHHVLAAHRGSADLRIDIADPDTITSAVRDLETLDAVICASGSTPFGPWADLGREQWWEGLNSKLLGQVELVRRTSHLVRQGGSFTLTSGILGREPIQEGSIAAAVNGALEAWVVASAQELWGKHRINIVSPTMLTESRDKYSAVMPGYPAVDADIVADAYVRSVEAIETGHIFIV
jgi:NAD(P)-dependent dehydrogenase (short-subunit alcohol dehydrogenase family)